MNPTRTLAIALALFVPLLSGPSASQQPEQGASKVARWVVVPAPGARTIGDASFEAGAYDHRYAYQFSKDWFSKRVSSWVAMLEPYMGKPGFQYLEVGIYEGRSFTWVLDHVATAPDSYATGIDIRLSERLEKNIELSGAKDRVTLIQGASQLELRKLPLESYDVIYIDGSHTADDVLEDMVLSWRLLKPGGLMILDDYTWDGSYDTGTPLPRELLPATAIDAFILAYQGYLEVVYKKYQVALRKQPGSCRTGKWHCSTLGDYAYDWRLRELSKAGELIALDGSERRTLERILRSKSGDAMTLRLGAHFVRSKSFRELDGRLGLGLEAAAKASRLR